MPLPSPSSNASLLQLALRAVGKRGAVNTLGISGRGLRHTCLGAALTLPLLASAWELQGSKTIVAHTRDQQHITLGTVNFEPMGADAARFTLKMDTERFTDHFLSMKEFKCLEGSDEVACFVPYPYAQPGTVTLKNMAWLEHNLLWLFKRPSDFGAKLWNGVYYKFDATPTGLKGRPQAIDLNLISAPPSKLDVPTYRAALRDDYPAGARWIESITIE